MSENTYQTLLKNEVRPLKVIILDEDGAAYTPSSATVYVKDIDDNIIVSETTADVDENEVSIIIGTDVTSVSGKYSVVWKILKTSEQVSYVYYHKTILQVQDI